MNARFAALFAGLAAIAICQTAWKENSSMAAEPAKPEARALKALDAEGEKPLLVHDVYFSLKDSTPENRAKLVANCKKYLTGHPGVVYFAAGTVADLSRDVNDRDWDVGLHVVFKDRAAHDTYQEAPRHLEFIKESKDLWKKVRVFDTDAGGK